MSIFSSIKSSKPRLNKFDLSQERKLSLNMGPIYPILLQEVIPGDKFRVNTEILLRLAPLVSPVMHRVNVQTHYFFVPNRLVWNEWEDFITGGEDGLAEPVFPTLNYGVAPGSWGKGTLSDYLGLPVKEETNTDPLEISALPFRAYALIYNEYFRDQNLEEKIDFDKTSGPADSAQSNLLNTIKQRPWEKDYFTSSLPFSQRGGEAVLPLGSVEYKNVSTVHEGDGTSAAAGEVEVGTGAGLLVGPTPGTFGRIENLETTDIGSVTINDLRKAARLQEWLEASARGGSRYVEVIKNFFGVKSADARLQRPEFLGGGRQPVIISEVLQTSQTDIAGPDASAQGTMAGHGISVGSRNGFKKSFTEHGYIIGLMSVLPKTAYSQGIDRSWNKFDKFDYYWKQFAHLGEQEVLNKELFANFEAINENDDTFGYQQRYAEYKYNCSTIHGDFRDTLKFWHMGREFDQLPLLNEFFIHSDPRTDIFALTDDTIDHLYCQIYNSISALRPMPYHSIPTL